MNAIKVRRIFHDAVRMYFAPLIGAVRGIRTEMRRADRQVQRHRNDAVQEKLNEVRLK